MAQTITGIEPGYRVQNTVAPALSRTCLASVGRVGLVAEVADTCHLQHGTAHKTLHGSSRSNRSRQIGCMTADTHMYMYLFILYLILARNL